MSFVEFDRQPSWSLDTSETVQNAHDGRGSGVNNIVAGRGGKNLCSTCLALHHPYPWAFCTLPSFHSYQETKIAACRALSMISQKNRGLWTVYPALGLSTVQETVIEKKNIAKVPPPWGYNSSPNKHNFESKHPLQSSTLCSLHSNLNSKIWGLGFNGWIWKVCYQVQTSTGQVMLQVQECFQYLSKRSFHSFQKVTCHEMWHSLCSTSHLITPQSILSSKQMEKLVWKGMAWHLL